MELRGDVFREIDATNINDDTEYDINVHPTVEDAAERIREENVETITVEFEDIEADSEEELTEKLEQRAVEAIEESGADPQRNLGYEVVKEYGDTHRKVGFAVVAPLLDQ